MQELLTHTPLLDFNHPTFKHLLYLEAGTR